METNFYTDEFEQLIKEKADQFRMYPSKRVWHSIYNNLHPSRRWPSAVISILFFFSLVFTGYLNTNDNRLTGKLYGKGNDTNSDPYTSKKIKDVKDISYNNGIRQLPDEGSGDNAKAARTGQSEELVYSVPKSDQPTEIGLVAQNTRKSEEFPFGNKTPGTSRNDDLVKGVDTYIKTNQIFADAASSNKKVKVTASAPTSTNTSPEEITADESEKALSKAGSETAVLGKKNLLAPENLTVNKSVAELNNETKKDDILKATTSKQITTGEKAQEKAWIENYAFQNKPAARNKWKDNMDMEFYVTPAVNYRKLSVNSKGSSTPFANSDINRSISQKPGFGFEAGAGISYAFAKNLRFKTGVQFNYTNYNINADQTNHPILTTVLMNDPYTGNSYLAARSSSLSNSYNSSALQPVVLHNRTYQLSIPVELAYKLSSNNNVEWFAGMSVQPTYVFGGNAHLISSDLKSYISEPSSIRSWNLNLGFETYMSYKLGSYNLQVGPQVRYQVYSTYRRNVALIEKPYAVGLKVGIIKGF